MTKYFVSPELYRRWTENCLERDTIISCLTGFSVSESETHILGAVDICTDESGDLLDTWQKYEELLPSNLKFCGFYVYQNLMVDCNEHADTVARRIITPELQSLVQSPSIPFILHKKDDKLSQPPKMFMHNFETQKSSETPLEFAKSNIIDDCMRFTIKQTINIAYDSKNSEESFISQIGNLRKRMDNPKIVYDILQSDVMLRNNGKTISIDAESQALSLMDKIQEETDGFEIVDKKKKNKNRQIKKTPYEVEVLESSVTKDNSVALICPFKKSYQTFSMELNVICFVHRSEKLKNLCEIFTNGLKRQVSSVCRRVISTTKKGEIFTKYQIAHFWPDQLLHPISVVYPDDKDDKQLQSYREYLHKIFTLPVMIPLFRWKNKFDFKHSLKDSNGFLVCPHKSIKRNIDPNSQISIVKGRYTYHHYMQDDFDDKGWGCAYRSLQTLISWFKLQSYSDLNIPKISDIQRILVSIGDKPDNFVNSRQWIGSFEVSFVIENLLDVTSKFISSVFGSEMVSRARELANHFDTIGSPVMIGGNNLAHTILGIDFNEQTGQVKFLILDPHYTGGEDIDVILNKGWCSWKEASFWNQNVTYNMCLPQAPAIV